jgi:hypothetical protein
VSKVLAAIVTSKVASIDTAAAATVTARSRCDSKALESEPEQRNSTQDVHCISHGDIQSSGGRLSSNK